LVLAAFLGSLSVMDQNLGGKPESSSRAPWFRE
jgi:hypothetical protein